jgi:hypothetical protein
MKSFNQEGIPYFQKTVAVASSGVAVNIGAGRAAVITHVSSLTQGTLNEVSQTGAVIAYIGANSCNNYATPIKVTDGVNVFANLSSGTICYYVE